MEDLRLPSFPERQSSSICPSCCNLDSTHWGKAPLHERKRVVAMSDLLATSAACLACRAIPDLLRAEVNRLESEHNDLMRTELSRPEKGRSGMTLRDTANGFFFIYRLKLSGSATSISCYQLYREAGPPNPSHSAFIPWPVIKPARSLARGAAFSVGSIASLISSWASECESKHKICREARDTKLPTRLIMVGVAGEDPHLYEPAVGEVSRYIALSHCWGPRMYRPPMTKKSNLEDMKKSIPMDSLCATFVDAVQLCRALDIRFLWIDSLCIIQDDANDWATESAKMAAVYRKASLTISASAAADSRSRLFRLVARRQHSSVKLCLAEPGSDPHAAYYGRRTDFSHVSSKTTHTIIDSKNDREPLKQRGWTFQEWILSPRNVQFSVGELLWDCHGGEACECQLGMADRAIDQVSNRQPQSMLHRVKTTGPPDFGNQACAPKRREVSELWSKCVIEFTRRLLTCDTDRLPALSGVAQLSQMERRPDDRYIAGHWESELPLSLLWISLLWNRRPYRRLGEDYAPSWSWASVSCPINYSGIKYNYAEFVTPDVAICAVRSAQPGTPTTANPLGPVRGASITVESAILQLSSDWVVKPIDWVILTSGRMQPGTVGSASRQDHWEWHAQWRPDIWIPGTGEEITAGVLFLPITQAFSDGTLKIAGLAVQERLGRADCFARVGLFFFTLDWRRGRDNRPWGLREIQKTLLGRKFMQPERVITLV